MVGAQRGLLILAAAGALALPSRVPARRSESGTAVGGGDHRAVSSPYKPSQKEYYLTAEAVDVLRPGLKMTINGVTNLAPSQKPVVDFTITDDFGNPLDRTGATTPGVVTVRFAPATWDGLYYTNLIVSRGNPSRDTDGTWQTVSDGRYLYTFAAALPSFDTSKPVTLFGGSRRAMVDIIGKNYYANTFKDGMAPDLKTAATTWGVTTTARCNQCHDPLSLHGGNYFEVKACAVCHNPNNMTGANAKYNGQLFWHNIHAEHDPTIGPITYPQDIRKCTTCHDPDPKTAPMKYTWYTYPTRAACGSCHAEVDFATGKNHSPQNLAQADDTACADCHVPQGDVEYDASVINAHILPSESAQLKGLKVTLLSATNTAAGQNPTVTFKITENSGKVLAPNTTGLTFSLLLGGNTKDYFRQPISESATGAAFDAATGIATYTFKAAIPADATGTWTIAGQGRRTVNLAKGVGGTISYTEGAVDGGPKAPNDPRNDPRFNSNPLLNVSVDGSPVVARRVVVDLVKCDACHYRLATTFSHGGQRIAIQFCVMCHNPNGDDSVRRPKDGSANPAESISFQRMIHRIHTGEELTQDYTIYGFNGQPNSFNEVTYPGDRRDCIKCHAGNNLNTTNLPTPLGTLDVVTLRDYFSPRGPGTAACTGCHDDRDTAAHAYLNTTTFPGDTQPTEACGTCHGPNSDWSPAKVHAR